jgi:hypothetical protein
MPNKKTQRQLADEAWLRVHRPDFNVPDETGALPGQLAIDGAQPHSDDVSVYVEGVPDRCPTCDRHQSIERGWTPMEPRPRWTEGREIMGWPLQCGACGATIFVAASAHFALREQIKIHYAMLNAPKPKAQPKRQRGAR